MSTTQNADKPLPRSFDGLVAEMPPQAIMDDVHYDNTVEMIDRLMASGRLTKGQALYLETLVQLTQAYEAKQHAINVSGLSGIDVLRHVLCENSMNASDLARLLGIHASMGSKILKGERSLTIDHLRILASRFSVRPDLFMG